MPGLKLLLSLKNNLRHFQITSYRVNCYVEDLVHFLGISISLKMSEYQLDSNLIDFDDVESPIIKVVRTNLNAEFDLSRLTQQIESNDLVIKKIDFVTEEEPELEVIVHMNNVQTEVNHENSSEPIMDPEFLKQARREQRRLIAGQRLSVPLNPSLRPTSSNNSTSKPSNEKPLLISVQNENYSVDDVIKPIVHIRSDIANQFLSMTNGANGDGIVWTPIHGQEVEDDGLRHNHDHKSKEFIDDKSIIEHKGTTKEFLMNKMLESIDNASITSRIVEDSLTKPLIFNIGAPPSMINVQANHTHEQQWKKSDAESMQLVSAKPCIVVESSYPAKVNEPGVKKTTAQKSAEARIAKEIEEIQLREAELLRNRIIAAPSPVETEAEVTKVSLTGRSPSPSLSIVSDHCLHEQLDSPTPKMPDILSLPAPPPPIVSEFSHQTNNVVDRWWEKTKVRPLVEVSDDDEPSQRYTFYKETAVEREIRLATQKEEELRKERQQLYNKCDSKNQKEVEIENQNTTAQQKSEIRVVSHPDLLNVEVIPVQLTPIHEPPVKLVHSGPPPASNIRRLSNQFLNASLTLPAKDILDVDNKVVELLPKEKPTTPVEKTALQNADEPDSELKVPSSAPVTSKLWSFPAFNSTDVPKRPHISTDRISGTLPNRNPTKGLMAKFLANHGRPMPVFVPKTTIPPIQPIFKTIEADTKLTNGHEEKCDDNKTENDNIKLQTSKVPFKRSLSNVESMILEELRDIQGRESELRKERSLFSTHFETPFEEENGQINGHIVNNRSIEGGTGAWGIFQMIDERNNSVNA